MRARTRTVSLLGAAQTLAWSSSYYLPAMVAAPMAYDLGVTVPTVFAAFSAALIVSAVLGPYAGRAIDVWGGRPVLMGTNVVFALGLVGLEVAQDSVSLFAAWLVMGIGMGSGLYEAAHEDNARRSRPACGGAAPRDDGDKLRGCASAQSSSGHGVTFAYNPTLCT